jgi:hypothetical protein
LLLLILGVLILTGQAVSFLVSVLSRRRHVSEAWLVDNDRREWSTGHEGPLIDWASAPDKFAAYRERTRA